MVRSWDIIRKILLLAEALPTSDSTIDSDQVNGVAPEVAAYHMRLLIGAGLAYGVNGCRLGVCEYCYLGSPSWEGHELLAAIRRDANWDRIKWVAADQGFDLTVDAIMLIARAELEGGSR